MLTRRRWLVPWLLMAPGLLWLVLFFVLPNIQMVAMSLSSGTVRQGFELTWDLGNYTSAFERFPNQFRNSIVYGGLATVLTFLIGYPLAYGIAHRGGRWKNLLLFLVIAPFFTSFLIRTISWRILLGDSGPIIGFGREIGLLANNFTVLETPLAVVFGLTYQFLPFMVLPVYAALERMDRNLVDAAKDLYAGPWRRQGAIIGAVVGGVFAAVFVLALGGGPRSPLEPAFVVVAGVLGAAVGGLVGSLLISESFVRVTFPLSLAGVFAGSILTFIPAVGDYVNAELLGNPRTQMIGNVIQGRFLEQNDFPTAAALSFLLMAAILIAVTIYTKVLGSEGLAGGRGV
jgi:spermidine/putrescine transport system permease protein